MGIIIISLFFVGAGCLILGLVKTNKKKLSPMERAIGIFIGILTILAGLLIFFVVPAISKNINEPAIIAVLGIFFVLVFGFISVKKAKNQPMDQENVIHFVDPFAASSYYRRPPR